MDACVQLHCGQISMGGLQVVSVAKWRGSQIAQVAQGIGSHAWVDLRDLAAASHSITLAQVSRSRRDKYASRRHSSSSGPCTLYLWAML